MANQTILIPSYPALSGGQSSAPLPNSMLATAGGDVFQILPALQDGQVYIGSTGGVPTRGNITGSGGAIITNTPGGINVSIIPGAGATLQEAFDNGTGTIQISNFKNLTFLDSSGNVINSFLNSGSTCRQNVIYSSSASINVDITNIGSLLIPTSAANPTVHLQDELSAGAYAINSCIEIIADGATGATVVTDGAATFMNATTSLALSQYQMARFIRKAQNLWYYELVGNVVIIPDANNVKTTQVSNNATYFPLFVASSTNSYQPCDLGLGLTFNPSTNILSTTGLNLSGLGPSTMVATDGSKNLISVPSSSFSAFVTVTTATQTVTTGTLYYNNYAAGQAVYTLPAATGSNKVWGITGLNTASVSGWKANAVGSDKIQFGSKLSVGGGSISSTAGSKTDQAFALDAAAGLVVVFNAIGTNLIVT